MAVVVSEYIQYIATVFPVESLLTSVCPTLDVTGIYNSVTDVPPPLRQIVLSEARDC